MKENTGKLRIGRCVVLMGDEPAYVRRGVEDLRSYLHGVTGDRPGLQSPGSEVGKADTVIVAGRRALSHVPCLAAGLPDGPQAYLLRVTAGRPVRIVAAGANPQGTKYALIDLICAIATDGTIPADLDKTDQPRFRLRGMYAHLHWQYNNPYALRSWSLDEWKRYVDLLAYMKLNLFQIWTMAAICPDPLSLGDEAYLRKYREVVRYAREERGMEVWAGECANNVAESDFGAPIEQREYFQVEVLKNPADRAQFADIMANRANMYRIIDNGDGYWIIDSDPGKWQGSPASEFADILAGNRDLIDRYAEKSPEAKLVYWIWQSWGTGTREENWRAAIEGIRGKVHEPWWLTPCRPDHLDLVGEMGYLGKSVYFPYGVIEPEPSNPFTHVKFADLAGVFEIAAGYPGLAGIMGNAQTPFAQLPNIFYLAECAWNPERVKRSDEEMLRWLSRFLFPAIEKELADGWLALSIPGSEQAFETGRILGGLVAQRKAGAPGPGGRFIFPEPEIIIRDLALLLRVHGYAEQVRESIEEARADQAIRDAVFGYLSAVLEWQRRTGFHGCRVDGADFRGGGALLHGRDLMTVFSALNSYFAQTENAAKKDAWGEDISDKLKAAGFSDAMPERAVLEGVIAPGNRRPDGRL